jgi:hypothetical protein
MKRPIATINAQLGDESFVAAFGRLPTAHDDIPLRIATHVGYVARQLRERGASDPRRTALLDALDTYVAAGQFPASETDHGFLPTFVDPSGVRCAVAHLVETSAGTETMLAFDRDFHNGYISDLAGDPRFVAWAAVSGFTVEELAWIQPGYPPPAPPEALYVLAATGQVAVATPDAPVARASSAPPHATSFGMADLALRYVGRSDEAALEPGIELDGGIGVTGDGKTAYATAGKLQAEYKEADLRLGVSAGVALDAYGPAIPAAWTVPADVTIEIENPHVLAIDVHGGPRFALSGDRDTGWNLGIRYRRQEVLFDRGHFHPQDLVLSADVTQVAGATFVGITVGVGNSRGHRWERWDY